MTTEPSSKISASQNVAARDAILASVRASLSSSIPFDAEHQKHHGDFENRTDAEPSVGATLSHETLIDNFRKNLELVGAYCTIVSSKQAAAKIVRSIIDKLGAKRIAISDSELVANVIGADAEIQPIINAPAKTLFGCDLGITSAQWAIAETGTLVLESDAESHRLTSLVPPVHLCFISAANIRQTLGEILELTGREMSRTITFITGASRTSDIELTLAIGVHGPGELHVVVIANK